MIINAQYVPNEMVERYCKIIIASEKKFNGDFEAVRGKLHDDIFEYVGCHRSLYRKMDREFNSALNRVVFDLTIS